MALNYLLVAVTGGGELRFRFRDFNVEGPGSTTGMGSLCVVITEGNL
jgi:hypothetical protein